MNEYEKEELRKSIQKKLENVSEESEFNQSMGEQQHSVSFADGFAEDLARIASETPEEKEEEEKRYKMSLYDAVRNSIDKNGEIVIYTTGYNLDDYLTEDNKLSPEMYWSVHKESLGDTKTYEEFLENDFPALVEEHGVSSWDDIMILEDEGEFTLLTVLTDVFCEYEYKTELERAIEKDDKKYETDLIKNGPYWYPYFNDIVVRPKLYNSLSNKDIVRATRWFIRHRLGINDKYNIRYATFSEKEGGRKAFVDMLKERMKEMGVGKDGKEDEYSEKNQKKLFKKHNIGWYYGDYLHKNSE
jgi:hypothetical protein